MATDYGHSGRNPIHGRNESIEDIEREIDYHRQEVDRTLESLERRLTPGQILDQATSYLRSSGGGEYFHNLGTAVKHNPVPFTLLGVGLGWLIASGTSRAGYLPDDDEDFGSHSRREGFRDAVGSAAEGVGDKGESIKEGALQKGRTIRDKAGELGARARAGSDRIGRKTRRQASSASRGYDYVVREQPLALGAVGLAMGMLLGLGLPETETEDELLGEKRDELLDRARARGLEKLEQAKEVADSALEAGKDEAKKEIDRQEGRATGP